MDTLAWLTAQNEREIWLIQEGDEVRRVPAATPGAGRFVIARVPARQIQTNLLFAALGRDGFVAYANWYSGQAAQARATAEAVGQKAGEEPWDDTPPDSAEWRAHTLALEVAAEEAVLEQGLIYPPFAEARGRLGFFQAALVRELVQWGREAPEDPKSSSGNSAPP